MSITILVVAVGVVLLGCGFIVLMVLATRFSRKQKNKLDVGWRGAAEELGLPYEAPERGYSRKIEGRVGRHHVVLEIYSSDWKGESTWTRCQTFFSPELPGEFAARRANLVDAVTELVSDPIATGDASFDKRVTIAAHNRDVALQLATADVRQKMVAYDDEYPLDLDSKRLHYRTGAILHAKSQLVAMVRAQVSLAEALTQAHNALVSVEA